ncbi:hypothetical protein [Nocardia acidivorans]|uniref:hypothetical protein n=1 Tax=Nocardia acidivorans TaxID=404580 RepID=UPI000832CFF0|nr:hypothetical protein [Nocardia acidivorans]
MPCDDRDQIERQVIADVLDTVEAKLRERERQGWRLTVPRSRIYAIVLHAVIVSARAARRYPATLDGADILDAIFDGAESGAPGGAKRLVEDVIGRYSVHTN